MSDNPTKHHHAKSLLPADPALRVKVIETVLVDKGPVDPAATDNLADSFENKIPSKCRDSPHVKPAPYSQ